MFKVYANSPMFYPLGTYSTFCEAKSVAEKALGHSHIEIIEYNEYGEAVGYTIIEG